MQPSTPRLSKLARPSSPRKYAWAPERPRRGPSVNRPEGAPQRVVRDGRTRGGGERPTDVVPIRDRFVRRERAQEARHPDRALVSARACPFEVKSRPPVGAEWGAVAPPAEGDVIRPR